jgi:probable HAF family extracellular repeat protein
VTGHASLRLYTVATKEKSMFTKRTCRHSVQAITRLSIQQLENRCLLASYTLTDLGNFGGGSAQAYDINEAGQVVGYAVTPTGKAHAFLWEGGVMTDLGTLGGNHSDGFAINEAGQVAGRAHIIPTWIHHAFLWEDGVMADLIPGSNGSSANGINDAGQVVGFGAGGAFLWDNGVLTNLGSFGGPGSSAADINNAGKVVGSAATTEEGVLGCCLSHAFVWQDGVMTDLGTLPGHDESGAAAINSLGQVAGTSQLTVGNPDDYDVFTKAFFHNGTTMINIGAPGNSSAADVNDAGQVVGRMSGGAFVWKNGVLTNLNTVIPAGSGITLLEAYGINNAGQIVGRGSTATSSNRAFLLTPVGVDKPSISIGDVTVVEGNTGTKPATFTLSLSAASTEPVTVAFATANGTATADSDYLNASGTVTFAPGETTKTIPIGVKGDKKRETSESFFIDLTAADNALILDGQALGTILNDDK